MVPPGSRLIGVSEPSNTDERNFSDIRWVSKKIGIVAVPGGDFPLHSSWVSDVWCTDAEF